MPDQPGIDLMRRRIERASRQAPPPRRPQSKEPVDREPSAPVPPVHALEEGASPKPLAAPRGEPRSKRQSAKPVRLGADLPPVNLAIRVRKPLDDRLADVIHQLRRDGVRTSKVELIEMLLWEMPEDQMPELRERLRQFRDWAPRGIGAPLEPGEGRAS